MGRLLEGWPEPRIQNHCILKYCKVEIFQTLTFACPPLHSTARDEQDQVEFTVKPEEDLILEGNERTITRVQAGEFYQAATLSLFEDFPVVDAVVSIERVSH